MINWYLLPLAALVDALYVGWMWAAEKHRPVIGGLTSMAIWACTLMSIVEIADNKKNGIPILIGAFLGSYGTIYLKARKQRKNND